MTAPPKVLVVFGTRPEAIKMAPVVSALRHSGILEHRICVTSQHAQMLESVLDIFNIRPDYNLHIMRPGQDLASLSARLLDGFKELFAQWRPDLVLVHGDTTSAFIAALSSFYLGIPVGHVEAGLRTHDRRAPFPEEINRRFIDQMSDLHFAPTRAAADALLAERVSHTSIHLTGNTIVDAVMAITLRPKKPAPAAHATSAPAGRFILVTGHRRENFGEGFESICEALKDIAVAHPETRIVYPVHLNPNVQEPVRRVLGAVPNITLTEPLDYITFLDLMTRCAFLISDSGGVQEEACVLKKPVLLMREKTERPEAVTAGFVKLVGTDRERIVAEAGKLLLDQALYDSMITGDNPYGDGMAAEKIVRIIEQFASQTDSSAHHEP
ncbi:MAG: UDP-N-acetylglucosamine 2-epimerase (non-hydrolyzing) [Chitinispirillaceae bacterium]|nr:UDP-N-acetylglucosamine 2-epimerase (non-hydrolyzing) [Chitinispirillaceae bacterium]